jgi:hypothetical protein
MNKKRGNFMNYKILIILGLMANASLEARRCSRFAAFLGAVSGATAAACYDDYYYPVYPQYDFVYPGAPIYAYDYPTQVYAPVYAYTSIRYSVYPSYYYIR